EDNGAGVLRALVDDHSHHLGDDISSAAHDNRVAHTNTETFDLVLVVEGGIAHGDTADKYRLQASHRGHHTGAPHLEFHPQQPGGHLLGGKLAGDGPARRPGDKTQALLQAEVVHLVDDTVDIVVQAVP